jgi:hypothetical protein
MPELILAGLVVGLWCLAASAACHLWQVIKRDDFNDV